MSLMNIRLELAQDRDENGGNPNDGYEFTAPLTETGYIDLDKWDAAAQYCTLRRYRPDGAVMYGQLIKTERNEWAFSYRPGEDDNEYIYRFATRAFKPGQYVTITQNDESDHVYRVASVSRPLVFGT